MQKYEDVFVYYLTTVKLSDNRGLDQQLIGIKNKIPFKAKNFELFTKKIEELLKTEIGRGFVKNKSETNTSSEQTISYSVLKEYFYYLSITIIKE